MRAILTDEQRSQGRRGPAKTGSDSPTAPRGWQRGVFLLACLALVLVPVGMSARLSPEVIDRAPDGRAILIRSPQPTAQLLRELHETENLRTVLNLRGDTLVFDRSD